MCENTNGRKHCKPSQKAYQRVHNTDQQSISGNKTKHYKMKVKISVSFWSSVVQTGDALIDMFTPLSTDQAHYFII